MNAVLSSPAFSPKPIETIWKGCRFRSRLEARWAVFFETLGVRWEYEAQGFELRDGTRYLPDFYLPDQKIYIEIKPAFDYRPKNIYMAGKISLGIPTNDWRRTIYDYYPYENLPLPGFHTYVGPYPISVGGHGIRMIPCTHGLGGYETENDGDADYSAEDDIDKNYVVDRCFAGIDQCDILFAWIDTMDCYGTLAEIGYAKAMNKQILIGFSEKLTIPKSNFYDAYKPHNISESHDLWFIETMANRAIVSPSPRQAFYQLIVKLPEPFHKISQLDNGILIAGNPYPGKYVAYRGFHSGVIDFSGKRISIGGYSETDAVLKALSVAYMARFEHGEQP